MSNKSKGSNAERELVHLCTESGWRALRVAGSGVNDDSPCDILIGKIGRRAYAIEAKSSKKTSIYISKSQINDFVLFGMTMGLIPVVAVRFNYRGWLFIDPKDLKDSGKNWVISLKDALEKGKRFGQFFEEQKESVE
jgi:Holliday junction resolvase